MATLTTQAINPSGITPTFQNTAAGDKVTPGPHTFIEVKNTTGSPVTVTVTDPLSVGPAGATAFNPSLSVVVPATTGDKIIGPLPKERFAALSDGLVALSYTATGAGITVAAFSS